MGVTLKDLLPGLIGLGVGSISPRAGAAGANTLETMQEMKDKRTAREYGAERMEMSRDAASRAVAAEGRAQKAELRADSNYTYQERLRADADHEEALARNSAKELVTSLEALGPLPTEIRDPLLASKTQSQVAQYGEKARAFYSNTPMDAKAIADYQKTLQPGVIAYVTERLPGGRLVKRTVRGPALKTGSGLTGLTTGLNAAQRLQGAGMTLEHAEEEYTEAGEAQFAKGRENAYVTEPIRSSDPGAAGDLLRSETILDLGDEERAIEKAEFGMQGAQQDFLATLMQHPEMIQALMQILGGQMVNGLNLAPQGGAPAQAQTQAQAAPTSPRVSAIAYSDTYKKKPPTKKEE